MSTSSSDSTDMQYSDNQTVTSFSRKDLNAVMLTFALASRSAQFETHRLYYVSVTAANYRLTGKTESRTAPGGYVKVIMVPGSIPQDGKVMVRLHAGKTRLRSAKFHEYCFRMERIRRLLKSYIIVHFDDAPDLTMYVEEPPAPESHWVTIRGHNSCVAGPRLAFSFASDCMSVVSRRRCDGSWAPILRTRGSVYNEAVCTRLYYSVKGEDEVVLRFDVFAVTSHGHLRRDCTMHCSLAYILSIVPRVRLAMYAPAGKSDGDANDERIGDRITGYIDVDWKKQEKVGETEVEFDTVLFGPRGSPRDEFNIDTTTITEATVPLMCPSPYAIMATNSQILLTSGEWAKSKNCFVVSSAQRALKVVHSALSRSRTARTIDESEAFCASDSSKNTERTSSSAHVAQPGHS